MGGILLCDNKKYNPPVRPRVPRIPLDKEDPSPRKAPSVVSEEKEMGIPGENQPSKRNIGNLCAWKYAFNKLIRMVVVNYYTQIINGPFANKHAFNYMGFI